MNTKQFQYVLALAREGSFSRAADTLNISQPSLSQYIKKIEKEVGLALFDRSGGDVRVTDAGAVYIEIARQILDLEHQMDTSLSEIAGNRAGSLLIGAAPYRAASMMPSIAAAFRERHPGIRLVVREGTTAELAEGMEHGAYDLALTLLPVDERLFRWERIVEEELILAVPASLPPFQTEQVPGRKYPAVDVTALEGQLFVMLTQTQFMQRQLHSILSEKKIAVRTAAIVKSLEAQIEMVKAGVGIALMPSGIERFCADSSVAFYSFREELPKRQVVVMWRKDRRLPKIAEELKEVIRGLPW